jgi:ABC-type lipoprotein export system ATPase subunit
MNAVSISDLFCLYEVPDGTVAALRGLSLEVADGERLLVHGPNGSGKTTLLRVLMGMQSASAGTAQVAGVELVAADEATRSRLRRTTIGVVDQHTARVLRPELTVRDNVALQLRLSSVGRTEAVTRASSVLDRLGLRSLAHRQPASLSGGEAQRVAVCAALAHLPRVVLADEPTGELDAASADQVYDLLADAVTAFGATLIIVTHDRNAARIADRVVRIRDGRLSEQWSPSAPDDEFLVVDDRGWLRLPETLRIPTGASRSVRAVLEFGRIVLTGTGHHGAAEPPPPAAAVPDDGPAGPVALLDSIRVAYGERIVLDGVDLDVQPASLTVVRGRSGSGKSTLLRVLLGLADANDGVAVLAGVDLSILDRTARADLRRRHAAFAEQADALAESLDIGENLMLARAARGLPDDPRTVEEVLAELALHPLRRRAVRLLSGGERQRVAVARTLVVRRPLVVLDEPTSQQDEAHAQLVARALRRAARSGTAVLCATHDPVIADSADHVLTLV